MAAGFVDGEGARDADGVAVRGAEAEELGLAAEEDDGELGFRVLEGEVAVATGGRSPIGDFAFDDDVAVSALDEIADMADELADAEYFLRGSFAGDSFRCGWQDLSFGGGGSAEGAGLFCEDVGGGDVGWRVEEGWGGGLRGARRGTLGVGAAEVGEAGDVVGHRRTILVLRGRQE